VGFDGPNRTRTETCLSAFPGEALVDPLRKFFGAFSGWGARILVASNNTLA
jgi:hypothetical protein